MSLGDFESLFATIIGNRIISDPTMLPTWQNFCNTKDVDILIKAGVYDTTHHTMANAYFYCLNYMKSHFDAVASILPHIINPAPNAIVIDIGSGPGTAALAFSEVMASKILIPLTLNYYPIDIDLQMNAINYRFFNTYYKISLQSAYNPIQNLATLLQCTNLPNLPINSDVYVVASYALNQSSLSLTDKNCIINSMNSIRGRLTYGNRLRYVFVEPTGMVGLPNFVALAANLGLSLEPVINTTLDCVYLNPDGTVRQTRSQGSQISYSAGVL